jgi:hypothetical protein
VLSYVPSNQHGPKLDMDQPVDVDARQVSVINPGKTIVVASKSPNLDCDLDNQEPTSTLFPYLSAGDGHRACEHQHSIP